MGRADADLLAGPVLAGDVDLGGGIVADDHRDQHRRAATLGLEIHDFGGYPLTHLSGDRFAIDDSRWHRAYLLRIGA